LSKLTEFNTLLKIEEIKTVIAEVIERKRNDPSRCPCTLNDVPFLRRVSQKNKKRLSKFLSRIASGRFSTTEARRGIDKSIEEETISEENTGNSVDIPDGRAVADRLKRKGGFTKKYPTRNGKSLSVIGSVDVRDNGQDSENGTDNGNVETRDIPGRRKPKQHERAAQWHDTRCFSLDEDDDQFYTAIQPNAPSPR